MQTEVEARQMATALLASHKKEAAAAERRVREQYEAKLREKQKHLHVVQDRLQVTSALLNSCVKWFNWVQLRKEKSTPW